MRPFELTSDELLLRIEEMVTVTIGDLSSEFLLLPTGVGFVRYPDFQSAYEVLKRTTACFTDLSYETVRATLLENSLVLGVIRSILGMTAPEWAELAKGELGSDITQGAARGIDRACRKVDYYGNLMQRQSALKTLERIDALVRIAVQYIEKVRLPNRMEFYTVWQNSILPLAGNH